MRFDISRSSRQMQKSAAAGYRQLLRKFNTCFTRNTAARLSPSSGKRYRLAVEQLEDRSLMSGSGLGSTLYPTLLSSPSEAAAVWTPTAAPVQIQVNTTVAGIQQTFPESPKSVATDANGNFVVVWGDSAKDGSGYGVYAQRYDSGSNPIGPQFQVNTTTASDQKFATVAMDPAGAFVITWSSFQQGSIYWNIYAQRYDAAGVAQGNEFRVNTTTTENNEWSMPTMDANGNFVIAWSSGVASPQTSGIRAQRYTADGLPLGGQMQVNSYTAYDQEYSAIASQPNGKFVIVWSSQFEDGNGWGVYGQQFDSKGYYVGTEFRINTYTAGDQFHPSIAADANGNFVVSWTSQGQDGNGYGIFAQRYSSDGTKLGGEFQVNTTTANDQTSSAIAMDADGHFLITWTSNGQGRGTTNGIYGQWYDASGAAYGGEFCINSTTGSQQYSSAALTKGLLDVVWSGSSTGDLSGVYERVFASPFEVPPIVIKTAAPPPAPLPPAITPVVLPVPVSMLPNNVPKLAIIQTQAPPASAVEKPTTTSSAVGQAPTTASAQPLSRPNAVSAAHSFAASNSAAGSAAKAIAQVKPAPAREATEVAASGSTSADATPQTAASSLGSSTVNSISALLALNHPLWASENPSIVAALDRAIERGELGGTSVELSVALGLSLSASYFVFQFRTLYSVLGSLLFATPLWEQFDMIRALEGASKNKNKWRSLTDDHEDDERLSPILG